ncbi:MAG: geranylgeranyl reductase family protein [Candidatus Aenigmatarchaeota archaeon]
MYDLIVSGAGPVGSHLARQFTKKGQDVLLLEKGEVGKPLKGTGHVSTDIFDHVPKDESFIEKEIYGAEVHDRFGSYSFGRDRLTSYVIDRVEFDKYMVDLAKEEGVEFKNEKFDGYEAERGKVIVETNEGKYESRLLAGCDGPQSDVRTASEMDGPKMFLHGIFTEQIEVEPIEQDYVELFLDASDDFFGWKVPREESFEYGLALEQGRDTREALERFSEKEGFNIRKVYAGMIPILPPEEIHKGRAFLCGDAAGHTKPFSGGGLIYGLTAAKIVAETIDPERPTTLENYEDEWRDELMGEINLGDKIRKFYKRPSWFREPMLWLGEKMSQGAHMDRPSSLLR